MIPEHLRTQISERLEKEIGQDENVGQFIYHFAAFDSDGDIDYALDVLGTTSSEAIKKAINIIIDELTQP